MATPIVTVIHEQQGDGARIKDYVHIEIEGMPAHQKPARAMRGKLGKAVTYDPCKTYKKNLRREIMTQLFDVTGINTLPIFGVHRAIIDIQFFVDAKNNHPHSMFVLIMDVIDGIFVSNSFKVKKVTTRSDVSDRPRTVITAKMRFT